MAGCGHAPTMEEAQLFISPCRSRSRSHRPWLPETLVPFVTFGFSPAKRSEIQTQGVFQLGECFRKPRALLGESDRPAEWHSWFRPGRFKAVPACHFRYFASVVGEMGTWAGVPTGLLPTKGSFPPNDRCSSESSSVQHVSSCRSSVRWRQRAPLVPAHAAALLRLNFCKPMPPTLRAPFFRPTRCKACRRGRFIVVHKVLLFGNLPIVFRST